MRSAGMAAAVVSASLAAALAARPVAAQEDFRSADLDRPVRVEDASPVELRAWELEVGSRGGFGEGGAREVQGVVELKAGLLRNTQVGVEVEAAIQRPRTGAGGRSGLEAVEAHLLYAISRETPSLPALALRVEAATPGAGEVGHDDAQAGIKGIATRSLGRLRLHANAGYAVASDTDGGDYWRVGLGSDYPVGLFSRALLVDVYGEIPTATGSTTRLWVDVGARFQVTNRSVVDVGLATRIDEWRDGRGNLEIVLGFSRVFGLAPEVPPYPEPSIR